MNIELHYQNSHGLSDKEVKKTAEKLYKYVDVLNDAAKADEYDGKETSINLPTDADLAKECSVLAEKLANDNVKYIFVCGIGGSNLGPLAVYEALTGTYDLANNAIPKIIFVDTVSTFLHSSVRQLIDEHVKDPSEFILSVVSKSGATTETIANFDTMYGYLSEKFASEGGGDVDSRVVVTTQKDSPLWKKALKNGFALVDHRNIGGRYSIMSPVGQIPLRMAHVDVDQLLKGAADMRDRCLQKDLHKNPALGSAAILYLSNKNGHPINNNFFFNKEMESIGKWYRQLMGESIGKNGKGLHPTVSIGSTDLHSMLQLYMGGPNNVITNFVYAEPHEESPTVTDASGTANSVDDIIGKDLRQLMNAIYNGVKTSYRKNNLAFMEVRMPHIDEYMLGQYMQMKMIEMMFLGKLFEVNTFNQPNVEDYKNETRQILKSM